MAISNKKLFEKITFKKGDAILCALFFLSLGLTIWGINIYRLTIIDTKYIIATISAGVILLLTIRIPVLKSSYLSFWTFFIKAVIGAGFFYFGLLYFNQKFPDKELLTEDFKIVKTGTLGRGRYTAKCLSPYVLIDFYGMEKQLIFNCQYAEIIKRSTDVTLTYSKGAFGFVIIRSRQLKTNY